MQWVDSTKLALMNLKRKSSRLSLFNVSSLIWEPQNSALQLKPRKNKQHRQQRKHLLTT